jgi:hypothetical protein
MNGRITKFAKFVTLLKYLINPQILNQLISDLMAVCCVGVESIYYVTTTFKTNFLQLYGCY